MRSASRTSNLSLAAIAAGAGIILLNSGAARAIPVLQLYEEGGTYCSACPGGYSDSWAISGTVGLRLWVVADEPIYNVHFVASWNDISGNAPSLVLTGVTIGDPPTQAGIITNPASAYPGITDTSAPASVGSSTLGGSLGPGGGLQPPPNGYDGVFGDGRQWAVFYLGDMDLDETMGVDTSLLSGSGLGSATPQDSPNGDVPGGFQINVYDITFLQAALAGEIVNFDVWACTTPTAEADTCSSYAVFPYSHNAQWLQEENGIPEPWTLGLLGGSLIGLAALRRRRR